MRQRNAGVLRGTPRKSGATAALAGFLTLVLAAAHPPGARAQTVLDAAQAGDGATLVTLLASGADVNAAAGDGMTALHLAAEHGHSEVVATLLDGGADVSAVTRIGSYTPLHLAGRRGDGAAVEALLRAGADPNALTTSSRATPLHLAAGAIDGTRAVEALLRAGADPNAREGSAGQTPLMFAAAANEGASVRALIDAGGDPGIRTESRDVLRSLALDREATRRLRESVAEMRGGSDVELTPAQVQEVIRSQREFLRSGFEVGEVDRYTLANVRSDYPGGPDVIRPPFREVVVGQTGRMTALLHAARDGHVAAAEALLDGGADIDQVSADGTSPLLIATLNGQFDLALVLIERGADPNLASATEGSTPLFATLQTQWAPKSNYPQPRAHDAQRSEYMDVLAALLEAGANPNVRLKAHLWYWEYGLNKMGIDLTGATPFYRAAFAQDLPAMRLLAEYGADPDIPTVWPELGMRNRRQPDGRQQEDSGLPYIPEDAPNAHPIHAATGGGYLGLGAFSVRNMPDQFLPAVRYLVEEHGADVNLADSWGYRPIHYAASRGDNEMIEYLVSEGADVTTLTRLGQSPADMARGGRAGFFTRVPFPETVELLTGMGSPLACLHTHFLDTGDFCEGAGVHDPWGDEPPQLPASDGQALIAPR
ncbi:MAG: ankyrin repeat domain-containing protein [Gammaproteobacteria bacterium]|nr:ankyrin repeat domain-containing protein [Gammaproteobacteria bacterium]MDE0247384.1 ankyrin repeat domain-containing protein [Gammaproteobacteria bacterium]